VVEMGGACVVHEKNTIADRFLVGNVKARIHLEDLSTDLSIILKHVEQVVWEGVDWIPVPQDRDQCQAVVNIVVILRCHEMWAVS
jgi:hypothetical protein